MTSHTPETCVLNTRVEKLERKNRRLTRLGEVMFDTDLVGVRIVLALAELIWSISLLWHGDTFERPTYQHMAAVATEEVWAGVFLLTAWVQWSLLLIGDFQCIHARVFAAWNSTLWIFVTVSMYLSVYPPPAAISGETALAFAASWILIRPWVYKGTAT